MKCRWTLALITGALWAVSIYLRVLYPTIHIGMCSIWVFWIFIHDLFAGAFFAQLALIAASRNTSVQLLNKEALFRDRAASFDTDMRQVLRESHDND